MRDSMPKVRAEKANILGCMVDIINLPEAVNRIKQMIEYPQSSHVVTLNPEIAYTARRQTELQVLINSASLVTPDGIGMVWASRQLGYPTRGRVTGIDLLYGLCAEAAERKWSIYLLGAAPGVAMSAAENLCIQFPGLRVAGCHHGYFQEEDEESIVQQIAASAPQLLFVALGAPRQELWIRRYRDLLNVPVSIGIGGSLDVAAGRKKRAPDLFIKLNLEWLYRLLMEPQRLKRQLVLPLFMLQVIKQKLQKNRNQ